MSLLYVEHFVNELFRVFLYAKFFILKVKYESILTLNAT